MEVVGAGEEGEEDGGGEWWCLRVEEVGEEEGLEGEAEEGEGAGGAQD